MATITSESFDGVTAPTFPAGWNADSNIVTETTSFQSSANGIKTSASLSEDVAYFNTTDANSGDVQASAWLHYSASTGGLTGRVFCRMTVPPTNAGGHYHFAGMTTYAASVDFSTGALRLSKIVAGVNSNLGTRSHTFSAGDKIILYCRCVGSSIILRCQRTSDSKWLDSTDAWQAAVQDTISVTNAVISGAGFAGVGFFQQNAANDIVYADDFLFESIVTRRRGAGSTFL